MTRHTMKMKRFLLLLLLLLVIPFIGPSVCYANAAEPPVIIIIVPDASDDLEISMGPDNIKGHRTDKVIESYYSFYRYDLQPLEYTIKVKTADGEFDIILGIPPQTYNNVYTLNLENQTLIPGEPLSLSIATVLLRIILTLIIEAAAFYLFGYRRKKSWLIFLIANLITQGALNIWLNVNAAPLESYIIFTLVFGELIVFIVEMTAFLIFVNEHRRWRTAVYVIAANLLSLFAGGYLITVLPV